MLWPSPLRAEEKAPARQGIVVWCPEAKAGVKDKDIDSISGHVTPEVEKFSGKKTVSEVDIKTILGGEEKRQQCDVDGFFKAPAKGVRAPGTVPGRRREG